MTLIEDTTSKLNDLSLRKSLMTAPETIAIRHAFNKIKPK